MNVAGVVKLYSDPLRSTLLTLISGVSRIMDYDNRQPGWTMGLAIFNVPGSDRATIQCNCTSTANVLCIFINRHTYCTRICPSMQELANLPVDAEYDCVNGCQLWSARQHMFGLKLTHACPHLDVWPRFPEQLLRR